MKEVSIHVGQRIRLYRKTKNLTIETFAGMIHKSKATVSKYENGDISIDIETLFTIAQALGVPVNQLIDYEEIGEEKGEKGEIIKHNLSKSKYYMYFYDGRRSRIARNVIEVQDGGELRWLWTILAKLATALALCTALGLLAEHNAKRRQKNE